MAGHGYVTKGYTTYDNIEPRTRYQEYNENIEPRYQGYVDNVERPYQGYAHNDPIRRPVIVDSEGRKQPIISYTRPGYVPKRQSTFVDHVHTPEYAYNDYERPQEYDQFITKVNHTEATHYPTKPAPTYTWTKPKKGHQPLTTTTTGLAVDYLGRAITEAAPPAMQPLVQKVETYVVETIENRDPAGRYARPVFKQPGQETYAGY